MHERDRADSVRRAVDYQRQLTFTPKGVVAVETSVDPDLTQVIRAHAVEVTGFVNEGMRAMLGAMMVPGGMMGPQRAVHHTIERGRGGCATCIPD